MTTSISGVPYRVRASVGTLLWRVNCNRAACINVKALMTQHYRVLEDVQRAAGHADPSTTKLYDRRGTIRRSRRVSLRIIEPGCRVSLEPRLDTLWYGYAVQRISVP